MPEARGELGTCDCNDPYVVAPPSPPPGAPPMQGMDLAEVLLEIILPIAIALGLFAVIAMAFIHRRRHQERLRREYDNLLNARSMSQPGASGSDAMGLGSGSAALGSNTPYVAGPR